jgi:hypothetical protein
MVLNLWAYILLTVIILYLLLQDPYRPQSFFTNFTVTTLFLFVAFIHQWPSQSKCNLGRGYIFGVSFVICGRQFGHPATVSWWSGNGSHLGRRRAADVDLHPGTTAGSSQHTGRDCQTENREHYQKNASVCQKRPIFSLHILKTFLFRYMKYMQGKTGQSPNF